MNEITLSDIALMCKLIEVCAKRGAFEATEMKIVGEIYEKFKATVKSAQTTTAAADKTTVDDQEE